MKNDTSYKISVMQAYDEGKKIQIDIDRRNKWTDITEPSWNWIDNNYRIKPQPKVTYRPYNDFAEFRAEWEKHGGWIFGKDGQYVIHTVYNKKTAEYVLANYVWADDGTPCGIKVES